MASIEASAAFGVVKKQEYYGNGQTEKFYKAINGGEPASPEQQKNFENLLPESDNNRYYGSGHLNFGIIAIDNIKNRAGLTNLNGNVTQKRETTNQSGLELSIGYRFQDFRMELECLFNKKLNYNANPVLLNVTPLQSINSDIKNTTLFFNTYFDFEGVNYFKPYVFGGIGWGVNTAQTDQLQNGQVLASKTYRTMNLALNAGLGLRYRAFSRWDIDLRYRYSLLGPVNLKAQDSFNLLGTMKLNVVSIGLIYFF